MTFNLSGSNGLFPRLGTLSKTLGDINTFQGTTLVADVNTINGQFTSGLDIITNLATQLTASQAAAGSLTGTLQSIATQTANEMVVQAGPILTESNLLASLNYIIAQMQAQGATVLKMTAGSSVTNGSGNIGNGVVACSTVRNDGLSQENIFAETITATCVGDATTNTGSSGQESFAFQGQLAQPVFSQAWPGGSACNVTVAAVNGGSSNSNNNLLTGGDFESFTSGVPSGWMILSGVAGTTVKQSSNPVYTGSGALQFASTGAELPAIAQSFNSASGTAAILTYQTQYAANCWYRTDSSGGTLEMALTDLSGAITTDTAGTQNKITQNLVSGDWTALNGFYRTPYVLPGGFNLRVRLTAPLTSGHNLYIDRLGMAAATSLYAGGPSVALFGGASGFYRPDHFTVSTTNARGSGGSLRTFQTFTNRVYGMASLGLLLPSASSGSNTISDSFA